MQHAKKLSHCRYIAEQKLIGSEYWPVINLRDLTQNNHPGTIKNSYPH
jgi:hypothetical protein